MSAAKFVECTRCGCWSTRRGSSLSTRLPNTSYESSSDDNAELYDMFVDSETDEGRRTLQKITRFPEDAPADHRLSQRGRSMR